MAGKYTRDVRRWLSSSPSLGVDLELQMYKENWTFTEEAGAILKRIDGDHENEILRSLAQQAINHGFGQLVGKWRFDAVAPTMGKLFEAPINILRELDVAFGQKDLGADHEGHRTSV
ncbi:hypothetical protein BKA63DRAFT_571599 [Paraphoma chrysanthemicola]|nr:hypothetical protein BKA63DRAFT_571599 [Paraphoma chrysanthemicola]